MNCQFHRRFGPFWEACSAEASVLLFLFLKRLLRGKSFFSLSCSSERLRSSQPQTPTSVASAVFHQCDHMLFLQLMQRAKHKHPTRGMRWIRKRYWHHEGTRNWVFSTSNGTELRTHSRSAIQRYTKVKGEVSLYDGNMLYWSKRLKYHPLLSGTLGKLLQKQQEKCRWRECASLVSQRLSQYS
jgi:Group II intron, maturase-specific domain